MKKKTFDLSAIEGITGGKPDRIISYIDMYIDLTSKEIIQLITAAEEKNWEELERAAHKMKAGSGYMGVAKLQALATDMEVAAAVKNPDKKSLQNQISLVENIFELVEVELLEEKKRLENTV
ncbi:MAG: hypothetical protein COB88_04320 [Flavobacteriales bacterium]|nr:MAG: hypothetical protein COB88_04320 [Flavobacteriales bacterium]